MAPRALKDLVFQLPLCFHLLPLSHLLPLPETHWPFCSLATASLLYSQGLCICYTLCLKHSCST